MQYGPIQQEPIKIKIDKPKKYCIICGKECNKKSLRYCSNQCSHRASSKIVWPSNEELIKLVWQQPLIKLAKQLGVTDNSIRNHCHRAGIKLPEYGHWQREFAKLNKRLSTVANVALPPYRGGNKGMT